MARKYLGIIFVVCLVVMSFMLVACDSDDEEDSGASDTTQGVLKTDPGALPVLKVGDTWTVRGVTDGIDYTLTYTIQGEDVTDGKACYVMELVSTPPAQGMIEKISAKMDKETLDPVRMQFSGKVQGLDLVAAVTYSYLYSQSPFPLQVGKSWDVSETEISQYVVSGETEKETKESEYTYKVEKMEKITVSAGTFDCFKVLKYDGDGSLVETSWKSDKVKLFYAKSIDHEAGETMELASYSVK